MSNAAEGAYVYRGGETFTSPNWWIAEDNLGERMTCRWIWEPTRVTANDNGITDWIQELRSDGEVESGGRAFEAPYTGHYLFLIGPVMAEDVQYLLRVDCEDGCE